MWDFHVTCQPSWRVPNEKFSLRLRFCTSVCCPSVCPFSSENKLHKGVVVAPHVPRTEGGLYWGYSVRLASCLSEFPALMTASCYSSISSKFFKHLEELWDQGHSIFTWKVALETRLVTAVVYTTAVYLCRRSFHRKSVWRRIWRDYWHFRERQQHGPDNTATIQVGSDLMWWGEEAWHLLWALPAVQTEISEPILDGITLNVV